MCFLCFKVSRRLSCLKYFFKFPENSQGLNRKNWPGGRPRTRRVSSSTSLAEDGGKKWGRCTSWDHASFRWFLSFFVCFSPIESLVDMHPFEPSMHTESFHRPTDCCVSYTTRNIRCVFMQDYYVTSSECSMPAVIFFTKRRQKVCANPRDERVQSCIRYLQPTQGTKGLRKMNLAWEEM